MEKSIKRCSTAVVRDLNDVRREMCASGALILSRELLMDKWNKPETWLDVDDSVTPVPCCSAHGKNVCGEVILALKNKWLTENKARLMEGVTGKTYKEREKRWRQVGVQKWRAIRKNSEEFQAVCERLLPKLGARCRGSNGAFRTFLKADHQPLLLLADQACAVHTPPKRRTAQEKQDAIEILRGMEQVLPFFLAALGLHVGTVR